MNTRKHVINLDVGNVKKLLNKFNFIKIEIRYEISIRIIHLSLNVVN